MSTPEGTPSDGYRHSGSLEVPGTPEQVYDLVSDVTRTGEWSPICRACAWEDPAQARQLGAWFAGHNEVPGRSWDTRSLVEVADRGREFAWLVSGGYVRWGYTMEPAGDGTLLTESWHFRPEGLAFFEEKYADRAPEQVQDRTRAAREGIPATLEAIRSILERG